MADAGFDAEAHHERGRDRTGVASIIPATIGRPTDQAPTGPHRAAMRERFAAAAADGDDTYGQRWQVETVNSMVKRNLGWACRGDHGPPAEVRTAAPVRHSQHHDLAREFVENRLIRCRHLAVLDRPLPLVDRFW